MTTTGRHKDNAANQYGVAGERTFFAVVALALLSPAHLAWSHTASADHAVLGWLEWITIEPWGLSVKSRLDTGAMTASLHALNIQRFERNHQRWVRFTLPLDNVRDERGKLVKPTLKIARPLERDVSIKKHDGGYDRRPVVLMSFCLNGARHAAEFSLTDRGAFNYPALLGRRFLANIALVDPASAFRGSQACPPE